MNNSSGYSGMRLSVVAGVFATLGSLFGKLAGGVHFANAASSLLKLFLFIVMIICNTVGCMLFVKGLQASSLLKLFLFIVMIICNTVGCMLFVKGLQGSGSSLPATVISAATNYFCSALIGFLVFGESTSLMWWCGTSLVLSGLILICCSPTQPPKKLPKDKEQ